MAQIAFFEAQAEHNRAHFRLKRVAAHHLKGIARATARRQLLGCGIFPERHLKLMQALLGL